MAEDVELGRNPANLSAGANSAFKLCMVGEVGCNYLALESTNIALPQTRWTTLGLMEYTNGIWQYSDRGTLTNHGQRYYRALQQWPANRGRAECMARCAPPMTRLLRSLDEPPQQRESNMRGVNRVHHESCKTTTAMAESDLYP